MNFEGVCCLTILLIGILFVLWLTLRSSRSHTVQPRRRITRNDLVTFDALVARWIEEKRLSPEVGATIHNLIVEEFVAAGFGTPPVASAPSAPVSAPEPAPVAAAPLEASTAPLLSATPVSAPAPAPVVTTPLEASTAPLLSATPISAPEPAPVGSSPVSAQDRWSWVAALLAPSSRRALLYLGAFLLMMSSLTLVIFSWASFSPAVQFALLAGATLAIWGTGTWMTRRPNLRTAGSNLQKIAATLAPVVAFALTRPGLLDLALRPAWQLTSFLSLLIYLLIAWRTRHAFYSGATTVAALSLIFAAPEVLRLEWQFVIACSLLTVLTPLSARMRSSGAFEPATGILHVSLVAFPLLVLSHSVAYLAGWSDRLAFSTTLVLSTIFCTLRYRINQCRWWLWLAVVPPLPALVIVLGPDTALHIHALALSALALAYLGLSLAAERRLPPAAPPLWGGALTLTGGLLLLAPFVFTAELWTRLAFGLLLLAHALLYALRHQADGRRWWLWLAVVVPPPALLVALGPDATLRIYALALSALALAYLGLSLAAERRLALAAMPLLSGALALGALTLLLAPLNLETARFALGPVAALGASWFFALERGRFAGI
ncbi:MAG: hypothetical protein RMJ48_17830 [Roseiflexaceae bacterium]|nr:hypothetical protein [Roseiflexaceae bacterium]